ncbi:hypothetical protein ACH5RR_036209 [Cinchona calisaya]|uniref:Wall-associated receptor kinase galacturonan-binding domain-containing protein n=1 Tax=Cinchona calisaya TaxID=153742 RepID=A0ABD2Y7G6_9GENT
MYEACAPKLCGNVNISFPFYIQDQQESYCGYPGFELNCSGLQTPLIHKPGNDYVIDHISYKHQTFPVKNAAVSRIGDCLPEISNITENFHFGVVSPSRLHLLSNSNSTLPCVLLNKQIRYCSNGNSRGLAMLAEDENLNTALEECERNALAPVEINRG